MITLSLTVADAAWVAFIAACGIRVGWWAGGVVVNMFKRVGGAMRTLAATKVKSQ